MSMFLSPEELNDLTGKRLPSAQNRALTRMGIEHKVRPDGKVIVLRGHVEHLLGMTQAKAIQKREEPDWGAIQ